MRMNGIAQAILAIAVLVAFLFVPLPTEELASYRENVSYEAVIVEEQGSVSGDRQCFTTISPQDEKICARANASYSVSTVECSNVSSSTAKYQVFNLGDGTGRFDVTMGFNVRGEVRQSHAYDTAIRGRSSETFTFSINRTDIEGCFFSVRSALLDAECQNSVRSSSETVCIGGVGVPELQQNAGKAYKEVERQRMETKYESLISRMLTGSSTGNA